jgi:hypothetical protein
MNPKSLELLAGQQDADRLSAALGTTKGPRSFRRSLRRARRLSTV